MSMFETLANFAIPGIFLFLFIKIGLDIIPIFKKDISPNLVLLMKCLLLIVGIFVLVGMVCTFVKTGNLVSMALIFTEYKILIVLVAISLFIKIIVSKRLKVGKWKRFKPLKAIKL